MEKKSIEHHMPEGEQNDGFDVAAELEGIHGAQVTLEETEQGHLMIIIKGGRKEGETEEDDEDDILRAA